MRIEPSERVDALAHAAIGAAIEVHRNLGPGFAESVYENALCIELGVRHIAFERQVRVPLLYRGDEVGAHVLDILVDDSLVIELKAVEAMAPIHFAQLNSYLQATQKRLGLLINFNVSRLRHGVRRVILSARSSAERTP